MDTEIIDKLFLELSQYTTAETENELHTKRLLRLVLDAWKHDADQGDGIMEEHIQLYNRAMKHLGGGHTPLKSKQKRKKQS